MSTPLIIDGTTVLDPAVFIDSQSALCIDGTFRPTIIKDRFIDGGQKIWGLKLTNTVFDITVENCILKGGSERALDWVRGGLGVFNDCRFANGGMRPRITSKYQLSKVCDIGIKGGVRDVTFNRCSMNDLLLGDYSIYDQIKRPKVRRITLNDCVNPNGGPIIIRGRYCAGTTLVFVNTKIDVLIWPEFVTGVYWTYNHYFGDKRIVSSNEFVITAEELV